MVTVQNVNVPGDTSRVNAAKYTATRRALLRVLPSRAPGMAQAEVFEAVKGHLATQWSPWLSRADLVKGEAQLALAKWKTPSRDRSRSFVERSDQAADGAPVTPPQKEGVAEHAAPADAHARAAEPQAVRRHVPAMS